MATLTVRPGSRVTRRRMIRIGLGSLGAVAAASCGDLAAGRLGVAHSSAQEPGGASAREARLLARPSEPPGGAPVGLRALGLAEGRDVLLYVPAGYRPDCPAPLVVSFHGAGGDEQGGLYPLQALADEVGLILLAPASRGRSWDVILGGYGPDVEMIDRALARTFAEYAIDPARLAVGGFSDGASYALSIGLTNGDLFSHILAFSPGFAAPSAQRGAPSVYVSHGTQDPVLPIDRCSRRIVPALRRAGYGVRYHEFEGGHTVPPEVAREAADWLQAG